MAKRGGKRERRNPNSWLRMVTELETKLKLI